MSLVSIVLPAKNASRFLDETIETILKQTFENWELIAVDDHSEDETLQQLIKWSQVDQRIQVFENQDNGIIPALQLGLANVKGKLITRMDADDLMHERRLELMYNELIHSDVKTIITGMIRYFSDGPISEGYLKYESWLNQINQNSAQWVNVYRECVVASPNWMMYTESLKSIGGFNNLVYPEDYHLTLLWYQNEFQIKCLSDVTLLWREHPNRTSRTSENYDQKHFFDLKIKAFLEYEWNEETIIIWGENNKQKLTTSILKSFDIPFEILGLEEYQKIEAFQDSQLLVAVFPEEEQRESLQEYLENIYRKQGEDWWYL